MSLYDDLVRENAALRNAQELDLERLRRTGELVQKLLAENATLRKRAHEAESERDSMLSACVSAGWHAESGDPEGFIRALRKRVEELEISAGSAAMTIRLAQARAEKAEQAHAVCLSIHKDCEGCLAAEDRAEKAERERDEARALLMRQQDITIDAYKRGDTLQADLNAALDWIKKETCPMGAFHRG